MEYMFTILIYNETKRSRVPLKNIFYDFVLVNSSPLLPLLLDVHSIIIPALLLKKNNFTQEKD